MNKNDNVFDVLSFIQRIERLIYNYCILLLLEGSPDAEDQETLFNGISRDSWKIIERTRSWISSDLKNVKYLLQKSCHQEAIMINRHQYGSEVCQKTTFFAGSPFFILIFYLYLPGHLKLSWLMMICVETFNQLSCNISSVHISPPYIFHWWPGQLHSASICQKMKWMNTVRVLLAVFLLLCLATSSEGKNNKKQQPGKCVKPCMPRCKPACLRKNGGKRK